MSWYEPDVYYQPEKFGLTPVGEVEWSEPNYSFDTTAVWVDENGQLYWASDSGCSCPSPFENFRDLSDLETGSFWDLNEYLASRVLDESHYGESDYYMPKVAELLYKAQESGQK